MSADFRKTGKVGIPGSQGQWIAHQERGLEVVDEIGVREGKRLIRCKLGLSHFSRLEVFNASDHLAGEIKNHENTWLPLNQEHKILLDEQNIPLYKTLALMQISLEHYTDALLTLEQGRARALVDLILSMHGIQEDTTTNFENLSGITSFFADQRQKVLFMATVMNSFCLCFIDRLGNLSAGPACSVPVNFASEKSCPLYFVDEKALVGMY